MNGLSETYKAVLFDKDGTLFDFRGTWDVWAADFLPTLCDGDSDALNTLAQAIGFDLSAGSFLPTSMAIAGTNRELSEVMARALERDDVDSLEQHLSKSAANAPLQPVLELAPYLQGLKDEGYKLGVMTNDSEYGAGMHLKNAGVFELFDFVCGSDSGFGAKPDAEPLLAFCSHVKVDPFHTVMLGDSTHDLQAARAAGIAAVGVLTGVARAAELAPHADAVLADIGELPDWFAQMSARK